MRAERTSISGTVEVKRLSAGSKSDHTGVVLISGDGREYILRRRGGNPFSDPKLERLAGKRIDVTGVVLDGMLLMNDWKVVT